MQVPKTCNMANSLISCTEQLRINSEENLPPPLDLQYGNNSLISCTKQVRMVDKLHHQYSITELEVEVIQLVFKPLRLAK